MKIGVHIDLEVYKMAFHAAQRILSMSSFSRSERFCLKDPTQRSSRTFCADLAEANRTHTSQDVISNIRMQHVGPVKIKYGFSYHLVRSIQTEGIGYSISTIMSTNTCKRTDKCTIYSQ